VTARGRVERRGLDHYERFVDARLARGVTPVLTPPAECPDRRHRPASGGRRRLRAAD